MARNKLLTKSKYLIGIQSDKWLWTVFNDPDKIPELDKFAKRMSDTGIFIGELAKKQFPKGIEISGDDFNENLEKTKKSLRSIWPFLTYLLLMCIIKHFLIFNPLFS